MENLKFNLLEGERVKKIENFNWYYVTDHGRVFSMVSKYGKKILEEPRLLEIYCQNHKRSKYMYVQLYKDGIQLPIHVARLVANAFVGLGEVPLVVNHKDGNKQNNYYENLEWVTEKENRDHAKRMGLMNTQRGEQAGMSKLKEKDVYAIRELRKQGLTYKAIGDKFGVCAGAIHLIIIGKNWAHLK